MATASLANQYNQPLAARDAGVEQVPLQHGIMRVSTGMITAGYSEPLLL